MSIDEELAQLRADNDRLRSGLGLRVRPEQARETVDWLERENEMLRFQYEIFERSRKLLETEEGRKQALFALQYFYSIPLPVWVADLGANIRYWNQYAERTYHHNSDRALGRNFIDLIVSNPEKQQASDDLFAIIHGQEGLEHFNLCKDLSKEKQQVYLVTCCFPVFDPRTSEIMQAEISFDLRRLSELEEELEEMHRKYKRSEEELLNLKAEKERVTISRVTQELFDELRSYCTVKRSQIEADMRSIRGAMEVRSTPAEKRVHERKLDEYQKSLIALASWERQTKKMIDSAPGTLFELEKIREIIGKGN